MIIDLWYGDKAENVTALDWSFYASDGIYRGNLYIDGRCAGDFLTTDFNDIYRIFPWFTF